MNSDSDSVIPDHQTSQTVSGAAAEEVPMGPTQSLPVFLLQLNQGPDGFRSLSKNVMKWVCPFSLSISRPSAAASRIHHKSKKVDGKGKRTGDG